MRNRLNGQMWVICDIDGVIADPAHREHLNPSTQVSISPSPQTYDSYVSGCEADEPILMMIRLVHLLSVTHNICFMTARSEEFRAHTVRWLLKNYGGQGDELLMRKKGDHRFDFLVKLNWYTERFKHVREVAYVIEDRRQCVSMWRALGLLCLQPKDTP